EVAEAVFSPDGRHVLTVSGGTVRLWPVAPPLPGVRRPSHDGLVTAVQLSPDGGRLPTGTSPPPLAPGAWCPPAPRPAPVRVWDAATGELIAAPLELKASPGQVSFSADGRRVQLVHLGPLVAAQPGPDGQPDRGHRETKWHSWDLASGGQTQGAVPEL